MRQIVFLLACSLILLGCSQKQSLGDAPIKQSWVLEYLKGYDDYSNSFKLADGSEWAEEQSISDNRLRALYYPKKNLVIGQFFSGCNGALNTVRENDINNWQMTITQMACTRLYNLPDGSQQETIYSSRDIADRVFSGLTSKISRQSVDWDAGLLAWYSVDDELLATFKLEAAQ